jgi:chitinase
MFPGRGYTANQLSKALLARLLLSGAIVFAIFAVAQPAARAAHSERTSRNANPKELWVGAYVPGWNQENLDPRNDHLLDAITHFLHFAVYLRPNDGSLDLQTNELTPSKMRALVGAAHGAGRQALLVVGGEGAAPGLRIASSPQRLPNTLKSILSLVDRYGYDGIDVDWEPLAPQDADLYCNFIESLRKNLDQTALRKRKSKLGLTTAIEVNLNNDDYMASLLRTLHKLDEQFDRINLMTYAMANSSSLPFVWHNAALYPAASPEDGFRTPSADGAIREFLAAGFQPGKLGIGINLYGYLWQGQGPEDGSIPGQIWKLPPKVAELTYGEVTKYLRNNSTRWDEQAKVPYMSIPQMNQFLSYEDSRGIEAKVRYVQQNGLGGIIIWDIGRDDQDENAKHQLLDVINGAVFLGKLPKAGEIILH